MMKEHIGTCLVCGDELCDEIVACPRCETLHHVECWEYGEGCAVYGCKAVPRPRMPVEKRINEPSFWKILLFDLSRLHPLSVGFASGFLLYYLFAWIDYHYLAEYRSWPGGLYGPPALRLVTHGGSCFVLSIVAGTCCAFLIPALFRWLSQTKREALLLDDSRAHRIKALEARLADNPDNLLLIELLARVTYRDGQLARALELLERAHTLRPDYPWFEEQRERVSEAMETGTCHR